MVQPLSHEKTTGRFRVYTTLKFNMEPENIPPWERRLFFWKASFSGFMLKLWGCNGGVYRIHMRDISDL